MVRRLRPSMIIGVAMWPDDGHMLVVVAAVVVDVAVDVVVADERMRTDTVDMRSAGTVTDRRQPAVPLEVCDE